MSMIAHEAKRGPVVGMAFVFAALVALAAAVLGGMSPLACVGIVLTTTVITLTRPAFIGWHQLIAVLILIILFIPIRRYSLPGGLPFELEPYRVFVGLIVIGWVGSLLVDHRTRLRRTGMEGPLIIIVGAAAASIVANPGRVAPVSSDVQKSLMFLLSFILVLYVISSTIRRLDNIDHLAKTLVVGGAIVAFLAVIEARTGFNVFNHLDRAIPFLRPGDLGLPEAFQKYGAAKLRVYGSAQHPIALGAALVMLTPLALYLARRYRQRRWVLCAISLIVGVSATVSRTGIMMLLVVFLVFLWLRPREMRRMWPALIPALIIIKLFLPGTLGAIKQSFLPAGGLIAEQQSSPGASGSGRLADLGPALQQWKEQPLFGRGYGTYVVDRVTRNPTSNILDNQWLGTLIVTGIVGFFGWLWFFARVVRRFGAEAKRDDSDRGWLLASLAAGVAAYGVGMLTYDAFAFIQVTFLLFILVGIGTALMAERPAPVAVGMGGYQGP